MHLNLFKENRYNNGDGYVITPQPEHLVMFTGSLEHYTSPEPREHRRISLAGDIVLTLNIEPIQKLVYYLQILEAILNSSMANTVSKSVKIVRK